MEIKPQNYDTIIFDLDFTLWDGCEKDFWAKKLEFPIKLKNKTIFDKQGKSITLQNGVKEILSYLSLKNKNIGFITRGGLLETEFENQPPIKCLKKFEIFDFFNYQKVVIYKTDLKSRYIIPCGKTLYIDDNPMDLNDISLHHKDIHLINRNDFLNWKDIL
jgi:predicted phosphatase